MKDLQTKLDLVAKELEPILWDLLNEIEEKQCQLYVLQCQYLVFFTTIVICKALDPVEFWGPAPLS